MSFWRTRLDGSFPVHRTSELETGDRRDHVRQLRLTQVCFAQGEGAGSRLTQLVRVAIRRKRHYDSLRWKASQHLLNGRGEVTVARNDDGRVKLVVNGVAEQARRDAHVGHLLFVGLPLCATAPAALGLGEIVPFVTKDPAVRLKGIQVD